MFSWSVGGISGLQAKETERNKMEYDNFDAVFSFAHLYHSYELCGHKVKWKPSVQVYAQNAGLNVYRLYKELHNGTFKTAGFYEFVTVERGKARHIKSVTIKERVMQRCLCDYCLVPALTKSLIYDNSASLKDKGHHFAVDRMTHHLRQYYNRHGPKGYIARFDFSKYFDSIDHGLIESILRKHLTDERLIHLTMYLVNCFGDIGLGLGSQVSQILAVSAPNGLDHYIKDELGIKFYGRYMDDFYILHNDLIELNKWVELVKKKCEELHMKPNDKKTKVRKINNTEYLKIKWFVTQNGRIIKKPVRENLIRRRRKMKKFKGLYDQEIMSLEDIYTSWQSWNGHIKHADSHKERLEIQHLAWDLFGKERWQNVCRSNKGRSSN